MGLPLRRLIGSADITFRPTGLHALEVSQTCASRRQFRLLDDHIGDVVLDRESDVALCTDQRIALMPERDLAHRANQQGQELFAYHCWGSPSGGLLGDVVDEFAIRSNSFSTRIIRRRACLGKSVLRKSWPASDRCLSIPSATELKGFEFATMAGTAGSIHASSLNPLVAMAIEVILAPSRAERPDETNWDRSTPQNLPV
jgi:hypothetical protein